MVSEVTVIVASILGILVLILIILLVVLRHSIEDVSDDLEHIEYKIDWYIQETLRFNEASPYVKHHGANKLWTPPAGVLRNARKGDRK